MISEQHFKLNKKGEPNSKCFCRAPELIENYDKAIADETQIWECHHRMELDGIAPLSGKELTELGLYFDRPPEELIFLTKSEHRKLHMKGDRNPFYGKTHSEEALEKIRNARKKQKNPSAGKHWKVVNHHRVYV